MCVNGFLLNLRSYLEEVKMVSIPKLKELYSNTIRCYKHYKLAE